MCVARDATVYSGLESELDPEAKDPPQISDAFLLRQFMKYNIKPGQVTQFGVYLEVPPREVDKAARDHPTDPGMQAVCIWNAWKKSNPHSINNCYAYGKLQFVLRQIGLSAVVKQINPKRSQPSRESPCKCVCVIREVPCALVIY